MNSIKKRKELKMQKQLEMQKERELQARINIKRTLGMMKRQESKLDSFKKDYIEKAKNAALVGNNQTYQLAKTGLKLCITKQRFLDTMISNFEIAMQVNDMNKVIGEFMKSINVISDQMKSITTSLDMTKAQAAYDNALANNAGQYEALDAFLNNAVDSIENMDDVSGFVSDEEIDKLISTSAVDSESSLDQEIDARIQQIKDKMSENL